MAIELPKYPITSLPTGGISYPTNWEIYITPFRFGQSAELKEVPGIDKRFYRLLLDGVECSFDKSTLVLEDVLFIGLARKLVSTTSADVTIDSRCPECLKDNKTTMRLVDAIKFEASKITNRKKYPVKVKFSKHIAWFRHLSYIETFNLMKDQNTTTVDKLVERTTKLVEITEEDKERVIYEALDHVGGKQAELSKSIVKTVYNSFIDDDAEILEKVTDIFDKAVVLPVEVTCSDPDCKAKYTVDIGEGGLLKHLSPFRDEQRNTVEDAIDL